MLDWIDGVIERECPVCRTTGPHQLVVAAGTAPDDAVRVSRCPACGSLATDRSPLAMTETAAAIDSYVEATAGIGTIAERLCMLDPAAVSSLLDVGCGYGFGADLGAFLFGWRTVGVEPSAAGRRGAAELGIDIRDGYVTDEPLLGAPFGAVLASEVLEHVEDPFSLLVAMRAQLAPDGVLVLTTPAAEVVNPRSGTQTVTEVLSVPYHHFVASTAGLEQLLRHSGFGAVAVSRFGAVLVALARVQPGDLRVPPPRPVVAEALEGYFLHRAASAAPGSALELGCATRAVRSMVARGAFDEAVVAGNLLAAAFQRRCGRAFAEPAALVARIGGGWSPPLSLPGAAFATGMVEMLHRRRPSVAREWFALTEAAAVHLRASGQLVDIDSLDLIGQSLGHGALCAAMEPAGSAEAAHALARLAAVLPRDEVSWWSCRVFVEAVSAGHYDDGEALLAGVAGVAHAVAASPVEGRRRAGLDALFTWGILRLVRGNPREALQLFTSCAHGCSALTDPGSARGLLAEANRHVEVARSALPDDAGGQHVQRRAGGTGVQAALETYWCDAYGTHVAGWLAADGQRWAEVGVRVGGIERWAEPIPRPDVLATAPHALDDRLGVSAYVAGAPSASVEFVGRTQDGVELTVSIELPPRPLPIVDPPQADLDLVETIRTAPPGPVLVIGARAAEEDTRVDEKIRTATGRDVVSLDIHPGLGVDVVADAHTLASAFAAGTFAVTTSSMVLEHLEAPWLVAAQCAAVTMAGGLAIHIGPFLWPEHAQPNDFWRFSPAALSVLFGPATGFEVVAAGACEPATVMPGPSWRHDHLPMPTLATSTQSWVVSRRTAVPVPAVGWAYDPESGAARARAYPPSGLQTARRGRDLL